MKKIISAILILGLLVSLLAGCQEAEPTGKPSGQPTEPPASTGKPDPTDPPETNPSEAPLGDQDSYWVGASVTEYVGQDGKIETSEWMLDLLIRADGTARFRDVFGGFYLADEMDLYLRWERAEDGSLALYTTAQDYPVITAIRSEEGLAVDYRGTFVTMTEQSVPQTAGELFCAAELVGTWLMTLTEMEGVQFEADPWQLESVWFKQMYVNETLTLAADLTQVEPWGEALVQSDLQLEYLNEPLYEGCENSVWCVRVGPAAPKSADGYPLETEIYVTLLDHNTLLLQRYFTIDGAPAVSHQTFRRALPMVTMWEIPRESLEFTDWRCAGYEAADGSIERTPPGCSDFSLYLHRDGTCQIRIVSLDGVESVITTRWALYGGGLLQLRGDSDAMNPEEWAKGGVRGYYPDIYEEGTDQQIEIYIYYMNGIIRLIKDGQG